MKHPSHEHSLILNVNYIAKEGAECRGCNEQIVSGKSSVYSCSRSSITDSTSADESARAELCDFLSCAEFLLHKSCAELPANIQNPTDPKHCLKLFFSYSPDALPIYGCNVCCTPPPPAWSYEKPFLYCSSDTNVYVCLQCAMFQLEQSLEDHKFDHPAHSQHPLALIQRPSSFKCDACKVDDYNKDLSYRCTKCQFWMHKSCADAPTTFQFQFHRQHLLVLSFSLPQVYHKFIQYCRLCKEKLNRLDWLYYCRYCRFFAHFQCARSSQMPSSTENEKENSNLVHLPATDESSAVLLGEQFVKEMSTLYNNNNKILNSLGCLFIREREVLSDALQNSIKHWAHDEHHLQLMTINELNCPKDNDKILLKCDGCTKPIRTDDDDQFYGCVPCKYFLHTFCVELPQKIEHYPLPDMMVFADKYSEKFKFFKCNGCGVSCNGIFFSDGILYSLHIGCAALPKMIKHEAHGHKLNKVLNRVRFPYCQACGKHFGSNHGCEQCGFYICHGCVMKSRTVNHPWDPHPLHLIYEPGMVVDHVHDFNCEYCSKDIDTNFWFYHCTHCDLSFHVDTCFERSRYNHYSNIKFGATDIIIDKLHPHGLTFVLNKKVRSCEKCHLKQLGMPVLECNAPCKAIFCTSCCIGAL